MPIPKPKGEQKKDFIAKCMDDSVMVKEFENSKQRYAVCQSKWKNAKKKHDAKWEDEDNSQAIIYE